MQDILHVNCPATEKIIVAKRPTDDDDFIFDEQVTKFLEGFAEQIDFHTRAVIVEHHADAITALANLGDETCNGHFTTRLIVGALTLEILRRWFSDEVGQLTVDEEHGVRAYFIKRMPREIQAKRFFFVVEQFALRPFGHRYWRLRVFGFSGLLQSEHIILACRRSTCLLLCAGDRFIELLAQATTRLPEVVHRARLDHGIEGTPINLVVINTPAKFNQPAVGSIGIPLGDQGVYRCAANAFNGAQAIQYALLIGHGKRVSGTINARCDQLQLLLAAIVFESDQPVGVAEISTHHCGHKGSRVMCL